VGWLDGDGRVYDIVLLSAAETMRRVQMSGAIVWVTYGVLSDAWPVVAANLLVLGAASYGEWRHRAARIPRDVARP
jgi:hypothetical protein